MITRLENIEKKYNEITEQLTHEDVISDIKKMTSLSKEQRALSETVELYHKYLQILEDINTAEEMEKDLYHCDLLIIDDLGSEYANNFSIPALFSCLNERLLHQRSTIISSNLGLGKLFELYSERTFSRIISSYTLIKLIGDDIRRQKKTQQYMEENHAK